MASRKIVEVAAYVGTAGKGKSRHPWGEWFSLEGVPQGGCSEIVLSVKEDMKGVKYPQHQTRLAALRMGVKAEVSSDAKAGTITVRVFHATEEESQALKAQYKAMAERWKQKRKDRATASSNGQTEPATEPAPTVPSEPTEPEPVKRKNGRKNGKHKTTQPQE